MEKKKILKPVFIKLLTLGIIFCLLFSFLGSITTIRALPNNIIISKNELAQLDFKNINYSICGESMQVGALKESKVKLKFKLFNLFPIKTVSAKIEEERKAYLGGYPVGLSIKTQGVIVVSKVEINTCAGKVTPTSEVSEGDIIIEINGKTVLYSHEIAEQMACFNKNCKFAEIKVLRSGKEMRVVSYPVIEELTGQYKLGLSVKDSVDGVGTVSYIKEDGHFGCLGHAINGPDNNIVSCREGYVYDCKILGYNRGLRGAPGELKGAFINTQNPIGSINVNNGFGVFGNLDKNYSQDVYEIGSRLSVKNGKAQIRTTINDTPEFYDIEIIKTTAQNSPCEKGMIIRVTDKRLLNTTGGILQGMSGSPIIQNNKIVGVVTHVLISDPTKGYGIYLDWMVNN